MKCTVACNSQQAKATKKQIMDFFLYSNSVIKPFILQIVLPELLVNKTHPSNKRRCEQLKKLIVARVAWMSLTGKLLVLFLHSRPISVNSLPSFSCQELLGLVEWHWLHLLQGSCAWTGELWLRCEPAEMSQGREEGR